jgi:hypothetical protein
MFIILRLLDICSTLLSVGEFGVELEVNPVSRFLLEHGVFFFIFYQLIFIFILNEFLLRFNSRATRLGMTIFNAITMVVVATNFTSYSIAKGML